MVGMVVTISPSFSLYRIVVFPAASRPTMRMRISFLPKRPLKRFAKIFPMLVDRWKRYWPKTWERKVVPVLLCAASMGPVAGQRHNYLGVSCPKPSHIPPEISWEDGRQFNPRSQVAENNPAPCPPDSLSSPRPHTSVQEGRYHNNPLSPKSNHLSECRDI